MGVLLLILAMALSAILFPLCFIYSLIKEGQSFAYDVAVSLDQMGNVVCAQLLNKVIVKSGKVFGNPDQTISYVMSLERNNLTKFGIFVYKFVDRIDKGHFDKVKT